MGLSETPYSDSKGCNLMNLDPWIDELVTDGSDKSDIKEEAINYDGAEPFVEDGVVYVKELGCNCDPASGSV
jgi:hypothetical protein